MVSTRLRHVLAGLSLAGLLLSCDSGSGATDPGSNPNPGGTSSGIVVGTWSLGTTGILQILNFRTDGTYSETFCDSTQTPRWVRQSGTWSLVDSTLTTTVARTAFRADTLHLVEAANPQAGVIRYASYSGGLLILSSNAGSTRVSLKYVAGTSGIIPAPSAVDAPRFSVPAGSYSSPQTVTLSTTTDGAKILYSLDGSNPLTVYTSPILVSQSETIRAVATLDGAFSAISSATYTIQ